MKDKSSLYVMMSGLVMGIAEVIPGVSGGNNCLRLRVFTKNY